MQSIIINAHAKINLTLYVGNVLENGYHNIDTVMHTVELHDIITLSKASRLSLAVTEGTAPSGDLPKRSGGETGTGLWPDL